MAFIRWLFMGILYLGMVIGLVYGIFEVIDIVEILAHNGWNWDLLREGFKGISYSALDLAVLGQSYVVIRYFIKDEDVKASQS